ncbi:MAG: hypothetical protein QM642_08015 [Edaphocola sp.]
MRQNFFIAIIIIFLVLGGAIYWLSVRYPLLFDAKALMIGNVSLAAIAFLSFTLISRGLGNDNTHAFIRAKTSATLLKLVLCVGLLMLYVVAKGAQSGDPMLQPSIFMFLGMYMIYNAAEAIPLAKMARMPRNK